MKRLLKNKKGGIIPDIGATISNTIQNLLSIIPKPILFLLFILILVLVAQLLGYVFNVFGIYCNSNNEPVKLNTNILTNAFLIDDIPDPTLIGEEILEPNTIPILSNLEDAQECSNLETEGTYKILEDNDPLQGTTQNITQPTWFYRKGATDCTICTEIKIYETGGLNSQYKGCLGDVYRKAEEDKTLAQKILCTCEPPEHYYFESNIGKYVCQDDTCTGRTVGVIYDELLATKGATTLYGETTDTLDPSTDKAIGIICQDLKPRMGVYGIDIFSPALWFFIILLIILFWGLSHTK